MTILITGAAGALGSGVAGHLISAGNPVALVDLPPCRERLAGLAAAAEPRSGVETFDICDPEAWSEALPRLEARLGPVEGAALIAGGWQGGAPLHEAEGDAVFETMLRVNLATAYHSLRALLPGMVARKRGSLVLIGSRNAERPWESAGAAAYGAAKAGVVALAQAVAEEVRGTGVRVNAVLPSTIDTPANRAAMPDADFGRWVAPESLAETIDWLLSDAARDVSGVALPVYGDS